VIGFSWKEREHLKNSGTSDTNALLTVAQVCARLGIGRNKFYTLLDQSLPTVKLGKLRRVRQTSLERWIEKQEQIAMGNRVRFIFLHSSAIVSLRVILSQ
jgi:excisionase family DNA binding protein